MELAEWHTWWKRSGANQLRGILMDEWDPIGVRGEREARDEYDRYLGPIGARLREGASTEDIAAYLNAAEEEHMGLGESDTGRQRNQVLADRLRSWHAKATEE